MNLQVKNLPFKGSGFWVFRGVTYVDHNWVLEYYTVLLFWYLLLKGISGKDKFYTYCSLVTSKLSSRTYCFRVPRYGFLGFGVPYFSAFFKGTIMK